MKNKVIWAAMIAFLVFAEAILLSNPIGIDLNRREIFKEEALIFSGNANERLAMEIASYLNIPLGSAVVDKFNDGEIQIKVNESVRNKDVFIVQPTCSSNGQSINDNLMELFLLVRTIKRASANCITAVIPYYGYARQDRKNSPRVPISAADVAQLLESAGVDRVVTVDLHCGQIQGFFHSVPVDNLYASKAFVSHFVNKGLKELVVVSPDAGGVDRAKKFQEKLAKMGVKTRMAVINKQRAKAGVVDLMQLMGDVEGEDVVIIDDLCDTGGTLVKAAEMLKEHGATRVFAAITHPVFSKDALDKIGKSVIDEMVISDTIPLKGEAPANLTVISVAPLLGEAMLRIELGESVSDLF